MEIQPLLSDSDSPDWYADVDALHQRILTIFLLPAALLNAVGPQNLATAEAQEWQWNHLLAQDTQQIQQQEEDEQATQRPEAHVAIPTRAVDAPQERQGDEGEQDKEER